MQRKNAKLNTGNAKEENTETKLFCVFAILLSGKTPPTLHRWYTGDGKKLETHTAQLKDGYANAAGR